MINDLRLTCHFQTKRLTAFWAISLGRLVGFEPTIFWATTRRVNPYTTAAMIATEMLPYAPLCGKWRAVVSTKRPFLL